MAKEDIPPGRKKFTEGLLYKERILDALNIRAGQTVVDAGCGTGYMAEAFSGRVGESGTVYALDIDRSFVRDLKDRTGAANLRVLAADITRTTLIAASSIDLIYISMVVFIFSRSRLEGFIREAERLLKPNGILAVVEIEKKPTPFGPHLSARYSPEDLQKAIPLPPVATVPAGEHFYMQLFRNSRRVP